MITVLKRPSESFADIIKTARVISSMVGADIAGHNYRLNWVTFMVIICIIVYFTFSITTIVAMFDEDWTYMLEASCMLGSVLQGITKLLSGIGYSRHFYDTRVLLEQLYAEYEQRGSRYCLVLVKSCLRSINIIKSMGLLYAVALMGVIMLPIVLLLVKGQHNLIMHFHIPYLDVNTEFGYFATLAVHLVVLLAGTFGLFAGDLFVLIYLTQPILLLDIFKIKIDELNELCDEQENLKDPTRVRTALHDLVQWHQFYNNFNATCNMLFYYIITMQMSTSGISILCTLYVLVNGDWPGVYVYLPLTICTLYIYCILGTKIENCNDNICEEIYNINWYTMRLSEQKVVRIMLMQSQNPNNIKVAGIAPLSVQTGLKITKTLYGVFTMMLKVVEK